MKSKYFAVLMFAAATAGCAAPAMDNPEEDAVQSSSDFLTLAECATQRDKCFQNNPFFGFFTCPVQYTQCVATASNGLPAQVTSAIRDAAACARENTECLEAAETADDALACGVENAECIAAIVDANLPQVVTDTAQCVEAAGHCIRASETVQDLDDCAEGLEQCALDVVVEVLPPAVGEVVSDVGMCVNELDACIEDATSPAQLAACQQTDIRCVADSLGVDLPDVPVAEAIQCAETAATCTLEARSIDDVQDCAADLVACNARLNDPEATLTCEQKWTQCLLRNPFAFFQCAAELNLCRAN